jgi:hypothetical protein
MPTYRRLSTCASFGGSRAHDVSLFEFMREEVDILAIFPQEHPLIVVAAPIAVAHTIGWVSPIHTHCIHAMILAGKQMGCK